MIEIDEPMGSDSLLWLTFAGVPLRARTTADHGLANGQAVHVAFDITRASSSTRRPNSASDLRKSTTRPDPRGTCSTCLDNGPSPTQTANTACRLPCRATSTRRCSTAGRIPDPYAGRNEYALRWVADRDWTFPAAFALDPGEGPCDPRRRHARYGCRDPPERPLRHRPYDLFRALAVPVADALVPGENRIEITLRSGTRAADALAGRPALPGPLHSGNCPIPNGNMLRKPQCDFGWDWGIALAPVGLHRPHRPRRPRRRDPAVTIQQDHRRRPRQRLTSTSRSTASAAGHGPVGASPLCGVDRHRRGQWPDGYFIEARPRRSPTRRSGGRPARGAQPIHDLDRRRRRPAPDLPGRAPRHPPRLRARRHRPQLRDPRQRPPGLRPRRQLDPRRRPPRPHHRGQDPRPPAVRRRRQHEHDPRLGRRPLRARFLLRGLRRPRPPRLAGLHVRLPPLPLRRRLPARRRARGRLPGPPPRPPRRPLVRRQRADRRPHLVRGIPQQPRPLPRRLRPPEPHRRDRPSGAPSPTANWWPSSPSPGPMSFGDTWHDDTSGDMHFWSVWHEGRDFEHYRDVRPRFCSEFGFQSYTSLPVIRSFADEADLNIASPVMESHQKNAGGNARIAETMFRYFRFPKDFAELRLALPGPAGPRDQDRRRLLALASSRTAWARSTGSSTTPGPSPPGRASTTAATGSCCTTWRGASSPR